MSALGKHYDVPLGRHAGALLSYERGAAKGDTEPNLDIDEQLCAP